MNSTDLLLQHTLFDMLDAQEESRPEMKLSHVVESPFAREFSVARMDSVTSAHVEHALHIYMRNGKAREATLHMIENRVSIKVAQRIVRRTKRRSSDPLPPL